MFAHLNRRFALLPLLLLILPCCRSSPASSDSRDAQSMWDGSDDSRPTPDQSDDDQGSDDHDAGSRDAPQNDRDLAVGDDAAVANVYYVSLGGDDQNNAGTKASPWRHINYAIHQATPPATVFVAAGEYYNVKNPGYDLHVSLRDRVSLVCLQPHQCVIRGGIYPASYTTTSGFKLLPRMTGDIASSTNEIFCGVSRFGVPASGSIIFPTKFDLYPKDCKQVRIVNNIIIDNQIRIACEVASQNVTAVDHETRQPFTFSTGDQPTCNDIHLEDNQVSIGVAHSQFWGLEVVGTKNLVVTNNRLQSGKTFKKDAQVAAGLRPSAPASALVVGCEQVDISGNELVVQCHAKEDSAIGYGILLFDAVGYPTNTGIKTAGNSITGCYVKQIASL